ncbi:hypothetical protein M0805_004315 [Coniferiporia weirii]|nr:hypothetical protein M0805_004315 [Coniferiporia weirii]
MFSYKPSSAFEKAAEFLTNAASLGSTSDSTKLEIYGLYKLLTVSPEPQKSRPSIFFITERAKWDAWKSVGTAWRGNELGAEARYVAIAQSLGWKPGSVEPQARVSLTAEELLAGDSNSESSQSGGGGLGFSVSTMQNSEEVDNKTLHGLAISGNIQELHAYFEANPNVDVNGYDEYGFTALHLACDRGNVAIVEILLRKGADVRAKDEDGLSAVDLAREANHEDIVALLEGHTKAEPEIIVN